MPRGATGGQRAMESKGQRTGLRVAVTGVTGNVGTSVIDALASGAGGATPPLAPDSPRGRAAEVRTAVTASDRP